MHITDGLTANIHSLKVAKINSISKNNLSFSPLSLLVGSSCIFSVRAWRLLSRHRWADVATENKERSAAAGERQADPRGGAEPSSEWGYWFYEGTRAACGGETPDGGGNHEAHPNNRKSGVFVWWTLNQWDTNEGEEEFTIWAEVCNCFDHFLPKLKEWFYIACCIVMIS